MTLVGSSVTSTAVCGPDLCTDAPAATFVARIAVVGPRQDNYEALKEICEQYRVRRLDLHNLTSTGEDIPDAQSELNFLVEFLPLDESKFPRMYFALEQALKDLFGREEISLLRTDDTKHEWLHKILTRRRTLLYSVEGQDEP